MALNPGAQAANALALDVRALDALKYQARAGQGAPAAREAARQFESLFMRELIKSMREAGVKSGLLDSEQAELGQDLLDQQLALSLSGMPGGLSEAIERQLARQITQPTPGQGTGAAPSTLSLPQTRAQSAAPAPLTAPARGREEFIAQLRASAERVAGESGIPAGFMLGQAGHETGWGQSPIKMADGGDSFNLFGVKAGPGWSGKVAEVISTEYVDGAPRKRLARFRAYDSYEDSLRDYARLIGCSPRYARARERLDSAQAYAGALQQAGYATDPGYARKLVAAIDSAQRLQRAPV